MPYQLPIPPPSVNRGNGVLDSHELHDVRGRGRVDGDDMTYAPVVRKPLQCHAAGAVADNRTSTQRHDELVAAVEFLTQKVNMLERRLEQMQGD